MVFSSLICLDTPGRLWSKQDADDERDRPCPLDRVCNAVRPFAVDFQAAIKHTSCDELTNAPAEIHIACQVAAKGQWADFGSIGWASSSEDAPRQTEWNVNRMLKQESGSIQ